jgi:hypothetical protein
VENILKPELIKDYLSKFSKNNIKNINECVKFILNCLDDSINQAETLPISGNDKKIFVISVILEIYVFVISKNLPIYLSPFDSLIKFIVVQIIISKLEALLVASSQEKDNMRQTILELTEKVAQLTVKVEFMQKENAELMSTMAKRNS